MINMNISFHHLVKIHGCQRFFHQHKAALALTHIAGAGRRRGGGNLARSRSITPGEKLKSCIEAYGFLKNGWILTHKKTLDDLF